MLALYCFGLLCKLDLLGFLARLAHSLVLNFEQLLSFFFKTILFIFLDFLTMIFMKKKIPFLFGLLGLLGFLELLGLLG